MKTKYFIITALLLIAVYYYTRSSKKEQISAISELKTDAEIIAAIKEKNKAFLQALAEDLNKEVSELDFSYLDQKTTAQLKHLLSLNAEDFIKETYS